MLRVAVCDDEPMIAHQIENFIYDICSREGINADIGVYDSGDALVKRIHEGQLFDLIYLDIQMKNGDGITAAENIRKTDENAVIIFISGYDRYLMKLFRLDVFAFIKKPIDADVFYETFLDANTKICNKNTFFVFQYKNREYKVLCKDILYFESRGRQVVLYMRSDEVHVFNEKLSRVEKRLENGKIPFIRIHQSYLVNYVLIKSRSKTDVTLINGMRLPISDERQKDFCKQYSRLLRGEVNV